MRCAWVHWVGYTHWVGNWAADKKYVNFIQSFLHHWPPTRLDLDLPEGCLFQDMKNGETVAL